jgi:glycosyltransferase involved in cell wall biosynthesis
MRILQVIPRFNPKLGGGVNVVFNVSKFLAKRGHEVTIITTDCGGIDKNYIKIIQQEGVEVIPFRNIINFGLFILSPSMKEWLSKNIKNYDVIHLNGARSYQNNIVCQYAKKYNIPYILQAHGSILRIIEKQKLKKLYDLVWGYKIYKESSKAIALTNSEAEAYQVMGIDREKIEIVPNGVDLSKFKDLPKRGEFRRKYSIQDTEKIVLYLGRLHKSKGIELLMEAFSELTTKLNNAKLFLVGPDDGYELKLKKFIKDLKIENKIIFTGLVSENEKIMALIDADVFVTPRFYGFPITFAESCVCGLPIITTKEGDSIHWIHNNVGYVTDYEKNQLSKAILNILMDEELRKKFSRKALILVQEDFNWLEIVKLVETVYLSVG